jgi:hypothetical protein
MSAIAIFLLSLLIIRELFRPVRLLERLLENGRLVIVSHKQYECIVRLANDTENPGTKQDSDMPLILPTPKGRDENPSLASANLRLNPSPSMGGK